MGLSRLQIAKPDILKFFRRMRKKVFKRTEINSIISQKRDDWNLSNSMSARGFIDFLREHGGIQEFQMQFPHRKEVRFAWGKISDYQIIQSLRPEGYFTHSTALKLHGLITQLPRITYLNYEQPKNKTSDGKLIQERIDFAFQCACRVSNNVAKLEGKKVCLLNGMFTGQQGVVSMSDDAGDNIRVTDVERTLIDCTVRPVYANGVRSVMSAFKVAVKMISVSKLTETLSTLDYVYPFHQAIGFYLERSGVYSKDQISLFDRIEKRFDFYLTHEMKKPKYSKRWRLYYPSNM